MKCSIMPAAVVALSLSLTIRAAPSPAATAQPEAGTSQGVVVLETEGSAGISVRVAEELRRVVNDGSRQRILPVIGTGSLQNITDLRLLDRCCYPSEGCADYAKQRNLVPHIESWMTCITTLYNEEFHLIARPEIKSTSIVRKGRMTAHAMPITVCL